MNVRSLMRLIAVFATPVLSGCTTAIPEVTLFSSILAGPTVDGATKVTIGTSNHSGALTIYGECGTAITQLEISVDNGETWNGLPTTPPYDGDCADQRFYFTLSPLEGEPTSFESGIASEAAILVRGQGLVGATDAVEIRLRYEPNSGPIPSVVDNPASLSNAVVLNSTVENSNGISSYRYKVGPAATTRCEYSSKYSEEISQLSKISASLSSLQDGDLRLCVIGYDGSTWTSYSSAYVYEWHKDTTAPRLTLSLAQSPPKDLPVTVNVSVSEDVTGFTIADVVAEASSGTVTVSNFTSTAGGYAFDLLPSDVSATIGVRIPSGTLTDLAGNMNDASNNLSFTMERPVVEFALANDEADEGDTLNVIVTASFAPSTSQTVAFTVTDVTTDSSDYALPSSPLTISAGQTVATIAVPITDDSIREPEETFTLTLSSPSTGIVLGSRTVFTGKIRDNDPMPTVDFALASVSQIEGSSASLTVQLSHLTYETVIIPYTVWGTANGNGEDHDLANGSLTIPAYTLAQAISFTTNTDALDENDETVIVTLGTPTGATLTGVNNPFTYTILDVNDPPQVNFAASAASTLENAQQGTVIVQLTEASGKVVTVDYSIDGASTATGGGVDYTLNPVTVTFQPLEVTKTIVFGIEDDTEEEGNETLILNLINSQNADLGTVTVHTHTILDNDVAPMIQFQTASSVAQEGDLHPVVIQMGGTLPTDVVVEYSLAGSATMGPIATDDYELSSMTATIPAGSTSATIQLAIHDDIRGEGDEDIVLTLESVLSGNADLDSILQTHTVTIPTNDVPQVTVVARDGQEVIKPNFGADITLSNPSDLDVVVSYSRNASSTASAGVDYTGDDSGSVTFVVGETFRQIDFSVEDDTYYEGAETLVLDFSADANATLGGAPQLTLNIFDNEPQPSLYFDSPTYSFGEPHSNFEIVVHLSLPSALSVTVNYTVTNQGGISAGDYDLSPGSLTIATGNTSGTITGSILDDAVPEGPESFKITLENPTVAVLGSPFETEITILANDIAPFTWTGAGGTGLWTDASNWSTNVVPSSGDTAYFGDVCSGANCNVIINAPINVSGIHIDSAYAGTITANANIVVSTSGFNMQGGTVNLGSFLFRTSFFSQTGGTFIASGNIEIQSDWTVQPGSTTSLNGSTVIFLNGINSTIQPNGTHSFHNLVIAKPGSTFTTSIDGTIVVEGDLTIDNGSNSVTGSGAFHVAGNVLLYNCGTVTPPLNLMSTGGQVLASPTGNCPLSDLHVNAIGTVQISGYIPIERNYIYTSGTLLTSGSIMRFIGTLPASINPGSHYYEAVEISKMGSNPINLNNSMWNIGDYTFAPVSGTQPLNDGTVFVYGNLSTQGRGGGSAIIVVAGVDNQSIESPSIDDAYPNLMIQKSGGTLVFATDVRVVGDFYYDSGVVNTNGYALEFVGAQLTTLYSPGWNIPRLRINKTASYGVVFYPEATVEEELILAGDSEAQLLDGTVKLLGDLIHTGTNTGVAGIATIEFIGDINQRWQGVNENVWTAGTVIINKTAGQVEIESDIFLPGHVHVQSGTVNQKGQNVYITGGLMLDGGTTWMQECGILSASVSGPGDLIAGLPVSLEILDAGNISEGSAANFPVVLNPANCVDTVITFSTIEGLATSPEDFTEFIDESLTIPAYSGGKSIVIPTYNDINYEGDEIFSVRITSVPAGVSVATDTAYATILDGNPAPEIRVASTSAVVDEDQDHLFVVTLSHPTFEDITFDFATSDGTAEAGWDYAADSGQGIILSGETSWTMPIFVTDDNIYEGNQYFNISISNVSGAVTVGDANQMVDIVDDEGPPVVRWQTVNGTVKENEGTYTIVLEQDIPSDFTTEITINRHSSSNATDPADYVLPANPVILPGSLTTNYVISIQEDPSVEFDELLVLEIDTNVVNGQRSSSQNIFNLKIQDNNLPNFNIFGVSGNYDNSADNKLEHAPYAKITWEKVDVAKDYDVVILNGGSTICSASNITAGIGAVVQAFFDECSLGLGSNYQVFVTARRESGATRMVGPYDFSVHSNAKVTAPLNAGIGLWSEYYRRLGPAHRVDGTYCDIHSDDLYSSCVNAGEARVVELEGVEDQSIYSCADLGEIADGFDIFDWACDDSEYPRMIVYSRGFKPGRGIGDVIDAGNWITNDLVIKDPNGNILYITSLEPWWDEEIRVVDTSTTELDPGFVYWVPPGLTETAGLALTGEGTILVVAKGHQLRLNSPIHNCNSVTGGLDTPDARCIVTASSAHKAWIEGNFHGYADPFYAASIGLNLVDSKFVRLHNVRVESIVSEHHTEWAGISLRNIRSGFFENVRVSRTQGHGLNISSSIKNIFRELWVDNVGSDSSHYGLRISDSSENFFTLGHVLNNENGIGLFNSDYITLSHLSILNNLDHQTRLESASQITMNQIAVNSPANATPHFFLADTGSQDLTLSQVYSSGSDRFISAPNIPVHFSADAGIIRSPISLDSCQGISGIWGDCSNIPRFSPGDFDVYRNAYKGQTPDNTFSYMMDTMEYVGDILDWSIFEDAFRSWVKELDFASSMAGGTCNVNDSIDCYVYDWRLRTDALIYNTSGNGDDSFDNQWPTSSSGPCPLAVEGDRFADDGLGNRFLINAVEFIGDGVGDDDGLCESLEDCLYTPHFGGYQGSTGEGESFYGQSCVYNPQSGPTQVRIFRHVHD